MGLVKLGLSMMMICLFISFFFFSSRRRHTRCLSDWSSDVCSSDLSGIAGVEELFGNGLPEKLLDACDSAAGHGLIRGGDHPDRSEERRVGKECRSRRSPEHEKKKNSRPENRRLTYIYTTTERTRRG